MSDRQGQPDGHQSHGLTARIMMQRGDFRLEAELSVEPGEVLAVLGPNGAGKTTLLRVLAGLLPVTQGRIVVAGQVWDDSGSNRFVPAVDRFAGLVFQDYRLFPHLTVLDNVAFGPRARGTPRAAARREAMAVVERLGLAPLRQRRPGQLSGGQAQRVALARALASRPRMMLLDEPLAALDARTRLDIRGDLRTHLTAFDGPSIVVTHDPLEALVLADRILVLEDGVIAQQGVPADVARRPATQYVARLMGLNLYRGTLRDPATGQVELAGGGILYAAGEQGHESPRTPGAAVLVAIPPSAVAVHAHQPGPGSPRNVWTGVVDGVELLTDRVRIAVSGNPGILADVTPAAVSDLALSAGRGVWLSVKASEVTAYADPGER